MSSHVKFSGAGLSSAIRHPIWHLSCLCLPSIVADHGQMLACLLEQWSPSLLDTVAVDGA